MTDAQTFQRLLDKAGSPLQRCLCSMSVAELCRAHDDANWQLHESNAQSVERTEYALSGFCAHAEIVDVPGT